MTRSNLFKRVKAVIESGKAKYVFLAVDLNDKYDEGNYAAVDEEKFMYRSWKII